MSVELELLMVKSTTLNKYANNSMLDAIWASRGILNEIGSDGKLDLESARKELSFYYEEEGELDRALTNFQKLEEEKDLPIKLLYIGSQWNRICDFFEREPNEKRRDLLLGALYGTSPLGVYVETSYGQCSLVPGNDVPKVLTELKKIDRDYLSFLGKNTTVYPSTPENSPEDDERKLAKLAEAFGLTPPPKGSVSIPKIASKQRTVEPSIPEDFDLETLWEITDFYEKAAETQSGVICGVV